LRPHTVAIINQEKNVSSGNVEVVQAVYAAMKQGDFTAMFSLIDPTISIWQSEELPWGGSYEGLEQAKVFFGKVTSHLNASVALERFIPSGEFVVALGQTQGTTKAGEKTFDVPLMHLWKVNDGKITSLQVFLENETMKAALSPGP
jgi:uncharacterized protein